MIQLQIFAVTVVIDKISPRILFSIFLAFIVTFMYCHTKEIVEKLFEDMLNRDSIFRKLLTFIFTFLIISYICSLLNNGFKIDSILVLTTNSLNVEDNSILDLLLKATGTGFGIILGNLAINAFQYKNKLISIKESIKEAVHNLNIDLKTIQDILYVIFVKVDILCYKAENIDNESFNVILDDIKTLEIQADSVKKKIEKDKLLLQVRGEFSLYKSQELKLAVNYFGWIERCLINIGSSKDIEIKSRGETGYSSTKYNDKIKVLRLGSIPFANITLALGYLCTITYEKDARKIKNARDNLKLLLEDINQEIEEGIYYDENTLLDIKSLNQEKSF